MDNIEKYGFQQFVAGLFKKGRLRAEAAKLGIKNVLLTCSAENAASARVMQKNGGILLDCIHNIIDGRDRPTCRYMIDTGYKDGEFFVSTKYGLDNGKLCNRSSVKEDFS